jgi:hypothetical protein
MLSVQPPPGCVRMDKRRPSASDTSPLAPRPPPLPMQDTMAHPWLVLPLTAVVMLLTIWHVLAIQRTAMPASRRRIRTASGLLMLLLFAALTFALAGAPISERRLFVLSWLAVLGLVMLVLMLAAMDMANTVRLSGRLRRQLTTQAAEDLAAEVAFRRRAAEILAPTAASGPSSTAPDKPQVVIPASRTPAERR